LHFANQSAFVRLPTRSPSKAHQLQAEVDGRVLADGSFRDLSDTGTTMNETYTLASYAAATRCADIPADALERAKQDP